MGIRDFFGGQGRVQRLTKTVINQYAQSGDRYSAMEALFNEASEEAWIGLLKRFTITSTKSIEDEEEKGWVYRRLGAIGKPLLPALKAFALESENVAWALRLVEDIANESEEWDILDALFAAHPPGYERDPAKKLQIIAHAAEIDNPKVVDLFVPYLEDPDETVRFAIAEALLDIADERARLPMLARIVNEAEDSLRLRARILDGFAALKWSVAEHRAALVKLVGQDHDLQGNQVIRR